MPSTEGQSVHGSGIVRGAASILKVTCILKLLQDALPNYSVVKATQCSTLPTLGPGSHGRERDYRLGTSSKNKEVVNSSYDKKAQHKLQDTTMNSAAAPRPPPMGSRFPRASDNVLRFLIVLAKYQARLPRESAALATAAGWLLHKIHDLAGLTSFFKNIS